MLKRLIKLPVKYLLTIIIITLLGGTLFYWLYPYFTDEKIIINYYKSALGVAVLGTFITYNVYLFTFKLVITSRTYNIAKLGIFCLILASSLWIISQALTYGFNLRGNIHVTLSIGVANYFTPYLDNYIEKILKLNQ